MNTGTQIYKTVVEDWLHHKDITNLELTAISKWQKNDTIMRFLAESALEVETIQSFFNNQICVSVSGNPREKL